MAKILYSLIAGGDTPLIESNVGASSNKYVRASRKILKKITRNELRRPDGMATLLSGSFAYNYIHASDRDNDHIVFLCVTEALPYSATPSETREAAFKFLSLIRRNFLEQFRKDLNILFNDDNNDDKIKSDLRMFSASMKDEMVNIINDDIGDSAESESFNENEEKTKPKQKGTSIGYTDLRSDPPHKLYQNNNNNVNNVGGSKFDEIIGNIERVKESVKENIEMAIDRHENMALLQSKTDRLADDSLSFRNRSRTLQYRYCRDLYKQRCVVICIIIFVVYLLSAMICGWGWQSCR